MPPSCIGFVEVSTSSRIIQSKATGVYKQFLFMQIQETVHFDAFNPEDANHDCSRRQS